MAVASYASLPIFFKSPIPEKGQRGGAKKEQERGKRQQLKRPIKLARLLLSSRRNELKRRRMTSPNNACMIRPDPIPSRYKRRMPLPIFKAVRDVFPVLSWILLSPYILYQQHLVLCDLDTSSCSKSLLDVTVDSELTGSKSSNHEQTGWETGERTLKTKLLGDCDQTAGDALARKTLGLVDLAQHGIGGLRDNGSSHTSNETRSQVDGGLHSVGGLALVNVSVDGLSDLLVDDEFGHGVWDLLEQDRTETGVEGTDTLVLQHLAEASNETIGVCWLRDETDTGGLERAKGDISKTCRGEVDGCAVVGGGLISEQIDGLLLEKLISSKLECALEEVTSSGWTETSQQSTSTLLSNNLSESSDQTLV